MIKKGDEALALERMAALFFTAQPKENMFKTASILCYC